MGRKYIAKNTCWKLCVPGLILFEKKKDCWKIVKKFQSIQVRRNGRWIVEIFGALEVWDTPRRLIYL